MIFAINLLFSIICSFGFSKLYNVKEKNRFLSYLFFLFPVWSIWLIICGGQYYVGTDYASYYGIFKYNDFHFFLIKKEYLFVYIAKFFSYLNLPPQAPFYGFYFIGFMFLLYITSKLHHKTSFIFILLYIAVSTAFNNQLNGLRQYISVYICTTGILLLYENKGIIKFLICLLLGAMMHSSAFLMLPFIYFKFKPQVTARQAKIILILSLLFFLFGNLNKLIELFSFLIPAHFLSYIGGVFDTPTSFIQNLTKLIYLPFYWYSFRLLKNNNLKGFDMYLFSIGVISYAVRLMFINNVIFNRIGTSLILLSLFPLYYLLRHLYLTKSYIKFSLIILFFISFYLLKVVAFPKQEYLYNSIYLQ